LAVVAGKSWVTKLPLDLLNKASNKILEAKTYPEFKQQLISSNCKKCALCEHRTNIVVDRGNFNTKLMIIGEAPGENEDLQGKAFVGRAGKLMDELMLETGIDTNQDALIVNVVKCRPPDNRAPKQEEADRCKPFLWKQIELVKPKFIVLLGRTALKHLIPEKADSPMASEVGNAFAHPDFPGVQFMIFYHPAYILRDPRKKPIMREHIAKLKQLILK